MIDPLTGSLLGAGISSAVGLISNLFSGQAARAAEERKAEAQGLLEGARMQQQGMSQAQEQRENALKGLIESYRAGLGGLGGF